MPSWRTMKLEEVSQTILTMLQKFWILLSCSPNRSKYLCRTPWAYDSEKKEMGCWHIGEGLFTGIQMLRASTLVTSKIFFKVPLTCSPAGPGTPCSPGTPGNPYKTEGEIKELLPLREGSVIFKQAVTAQDSVSSGSSIQNKRVQNTNAVPKCTI